MRYNGALITHSALFQSWWTKLATEFKDNSSVIFDINNEPHAITPAQAGVNGISAAGATKQLILVFGTS
ncbi:hypothetical protein EV426DRAFT_622912 [Tirmania nivea]|nr:hypothetical protein EV426DRAFT_622912 [Tirmania nivea]